MSQKSLMDVFTIYTSKVRDISTDLLYGRGRLRVVPACTLERTTAQELLVFGVRANLLSIPTHELCDFLRSRIAGRTAIEIGSGHGGLAHALSIPATDNRQQEDEGITSYYDELGQPTIR